MPKTNKPPIFTNVSASKAFDVWQARRLRAQSGLELARDWEDLERGLISNIVLTSVRLAAATGKGATLNPLATRLKVGIYSESDQVRNGCPMGIFSDY